MREIRKRVSELQVGDVVKGYGVIRKTRISGACRAVWTGSASPDHWPSDAEVTVLVEDKRYVVTVRYESTDRAALERCWPSESLRPGYINEKVKRYVSEIKEVSE